MRESESKMICAMASSNTPPPFFLSEGLQVRRAPDSQRTLDSPPGRFGPGHGTRGWDTGSQPPEMRKNAILRPSRGPNRSSKQPVWLAENSADRHRPLAKSPKRSRVLDTCIRHTREPLQSQRYPRACPGYDRLGLIWSMRSGAGVMNRSDGECGRVS